MPWQPPCMDLGHPLICYFFLINPRPCLPFRSFKWNPRLSALQPRLPASLLHDENRTKCAAAAPFSIHNSQAARPDISGRETHELRGTDTTVPNHNLGKSTQRQAIRERFRGSSLDCVIPETEQLACSVQASFKLTVSKCIWTNLKLRRWEEEEAQHLFHNICILDDSKTTSVADSRSGYFSGYVSQRYCSAIYPNGWLLRDVVESLRSNVLPFCPTFDSELCLEKVQMKASHMEALGLLFSDSPSHFAIGPNVNGIRSVPYMAFDDSCQKRHGTDGFQLKPLIISALIYWVTNAHWEAFINRTKNSYVHKYQLWLVVSGIVSTIL